MGIIIDQNIYLIYVSINFICFHLDSLIYEKKKITVNLKLLSLCQSKIKHHIFSVSMRKTEERNNSDLSVCSTDAGRNTPHMEDDTGPKAHIIQSPIICSPVVLIMSSPTCISSYLWDRSSVYFLPSFHNPPYWADLERAVLSFMYADTRSIQSVSAEPHLSSYTVWLSVTWLSSHFWLVDISGFIWTVKPSFLSQINKVNSEIESHMFFQCVSSNVYMHSGHWL